ncbi:hypothetical protein BDP67DRAFT_505648 [Colletotrichum lupini]|nr:hypothetical protein BDP67DRAFT_505648 [Colletotrichum lupini]
MARILPRKLGRLRHYWATSRRQANLIFCPPDNNFGFSWPWTICQRRQNLVDFSNRSSPSARRIAVESAAVKCQSKDGMHSLNIGLLTSYLGLCQPPGKHMARPKSASERRDEAGILSIRKRVGFCFISLRVSCNISSTAPFQPQTSDHHLKFVQVGADTAPHHREMCAEMLANQSDSLLWISPACVHPTQLVIVAYGSYCVDMPCYSPSAVSHVLQAFALKQDPVAHHASNVQFVIQARSARLLPSNDQDGSVSGKRDETARHVRLAGRYCMILHLLSTESGNMGWGCRVPRTSLFLSGAMRCGTCIILRIPRRSYKVRRGGQASRWLVRGSQSWQMQPKEYDSISVDSHVLRITASRGDSRATWRRCMACGGWWRPVR